jgi:hypothetical protein
MQNLVEAIQAAIAADASPDIRASGVTACRTILASLEPPASRQPIEVGPTASAIAGLIRATPPDQLLDLVIAKLRTVVPAEAQHAKEDEHPAGTGAAPMSGARRHHRLRLHDAIVWRYPEAPIDLAKALGEIAADLWVAGKLSFTTGTFVATVGSSHGAHHEDQDRDREAEAGSLGPQAVA